VLNNRKNIIKLFIFIWIPAIAGITILMSCGEKLDLSQFPINDPPQKIGDTVYISQYPDYIGFNEPVDIFVGYEPLIYVADKSNNRIVQLDISGALIGYSDFILKPKKISQDKNFDLLVIASKIDTIPPNILDTVDCVYRYKLKDNNGIISGVQPKIVFKSNQATPIPGKHGKFTGVATYSDNYYLVTRSGPNNSNLIDPDNAIFRIDKYDNTVPVPERLPGFEVTGLGLMSLIGTSAISTFSNNNTDLIYVQNATDVAFKINWAIYDFVNGTYTAKYTPDQGTDLLKIGLVSQPQDITVDQYGNIFIVDSYKDSLYKFNSLGKLKSESFGGITQFINPNGVAFFDKTLYITDTGNNRIRRYILSTDIY
jgi:hypothetical protein